MPPAPIGQQGAPDIPDLGPPSGPVVGPGFDTDLLPDDDLAPVGPNDWYDVSPDGETGDTADRAVRTDVRPADAMPTSLETVGAMALRNQTYIGLGVMALLALILAGLYWRRRRIEAAEAATDGPSLAYGVHRIIREKDSVPDDEVEAEVAAEPVAETETEAETTAEEPIAPPPTKQQRNSHSAAPGNAALPKQQPRIDLALEMTGATRSVMMLTFNFRLEISNRSDLAVRELHVSAQLATAQRGGSNAPPIAGGQPIAEVERIGPQQSRRVAGTLQIPVADINMIQQGAKPLFIPLLHVTIEGLGLQAMTRSFVIGTPSATSQTRVHPLTLDGPPGGLPMLRAQLIKQPEAEDAAI